MIRYLVFLVLGCVVAVSVAGKFDPTAEPVTVADKDQAELRESQLLIVKETKNPTKLSGSERIRRSRNGHYIAPFRLNNARVEGLIDTGASTIAINETTARRAGLRLSTDDFIYTVETANGQVSAARAVIDTVTIGSIKVRRVEAMVLEDRALNTVLIGMSFMNRLRRFEYANGALLLRR